MQPNILTQKTKRKGIQKKTKKNNDNNNETTEIGNNIRQKENIFRIYNFLLFSDLVKGLFLLATLGNNKKSNQQAPV